MTNKAKPESKTWGHETSALAVGVAEVVAGPHTTACTPIPDPDAPPSRPAADGAVAAAVPGAHDLRVTAVRPVRPPRKTCAHLGLVAAGMDVPLAAGESASCVRGDRPF